MILSIRKKNVDPYRVFVITNLIFSFDYREEIRF